MCCRTDSSSDAVWVNRAGTFGVASAPNWWAKLSGLIVRFVGHVMQQHWFLRMIYVDDLHGSFVGHRKFELLWIWLLWLGLPLGITSLVVVSLRILLAFEFDTIWQKLAFLRNAASGLLTGSRSWRPTGMSCRSVTFRSSSGGWDLCPMWLKPHLSPLFAWGAAVQGGTVCRLPETVIITLQYIAAELNTESFLVSVKRPLVFGTEQFRTDAKCTDDKVVLGVGSLAPSGGSV